MTSGTSIHQPGTLAGARLLGASGSPALHSLAGHGRHRHNTGVPHRRLAGRPSRTFRHRRVPGGLQAEKVFLLTAGCYAPYRCLKLLHHERRMVGRIALRGG